MEGIPKFVTIDNAGTGMHGYRFSMKGFKDQNRMSNIPMFAIPSLFNNLDS